MHTYEEARSIWIPREANVIFEHKDTDTAVIVYADGGHLCVTRLFTLSNGWNVSTDFLEAVENIPGLEIPA